jgi:hypothetical protein
VNFLNVLFFGCTVPTSPSISACEPKKHTHTQQQQKIFKDTLFQCKLLKLATKPNLSQTTQSAENKRGSYHDKNQTKPLKKPQSRHEQETLQGHVHKSRYVRCVPCWCACSNARTQENGRVGDGGKANYSQCERERRNCKPNSSIPKPYFLSTPLVSS